MIKSRVLRKNCSAILSLAIISFILLASAQPIFAQVCATPGANGAGGTLTGIVNTYYPGTTSPAAAATSLTVGAHATGDAGSAIASGDLLLVIQMQDATITFANTSRYGDNVNGDPGSGYAPANQSGKYEFVKATSAITNAGGTFNITGAGAGNGLINAYNNAAATGTMGQRRFQVVKVPQYRTATLSSTLTALAWNGTAGGILALNVSDVLTLGGTVSVSGLGFRGGAGRQLAGGAGANTDYVTTAANNANGSKGEGIAGTPRFLYNPTTDTVVDTGVDGYPGGSSGRGAPGNAGGGGTDGDAPANDENSGGGGGGNGGAGGLGGNSWNSNLATTRGFGGVAFAERAASRIVMGGGGGAGTRNNTPGVTAASAAAAGGGIVIIQAGKVFGAGTINANGADAFNNTDNDGGGGGGAGGSVVVTSLRSGLAGLTVNAKGGRGGDAWHNQLANGTPGERHGPGGGGGGGFVALSDDAANVTVSVTGGAHGITTTSNDNYGSTDGAGATAVFNVLPSTIPGFKCGTLTQVDLTEFTATRYSNGALIEWRTGREINNLGFHVYREKRGLRERINQSVIAGSALLTQPDTELTAGRSYSWWDDYADESTTYWLEDIDLNGKRKLHGPFIPAIGVGKSKEAKRARLLSRVGRPVSETAGPAEQFDQPIEFAGSGGAGQTVNSWDLASQAAVKIAVRREGWYRVRQSDLLAAGLESSVDPRRLQLFADGSEQPMLIAGEQDGKFDATDYIEFYGTGLDTSFGDSRVYWLVKGKQNGLRIKQSKATGPQKSSGSSFGYTVELKERTVYFAALRNGDADNFFGSVVSSDPLNETITVQHMDASAAAPASLQVSLQGVTDVAGVAPDHQITVSVNGSVVGQFSFDGQSLTAGAMPVAASLLHEGPNTITLTANGRSEDVSLLNWIRLTYNHAYVADSNSLKLAIPDKSQVRIDGFSTSRIRVFDVTTGSDTQELLGNIQQLGGAYSITVSPLDTGARKLLAISDDQIQSPAELKFNKPSSWHSAGNFSDLVMISHANFIGALAPLKSLRESQGLVVSVVDIEDIYDEFNFGAKNPRAVRDFLQVARSSWARAPRFALLVGDASFDPRNYLGLGNYDFVPTKLIDTQLLETASDDWFADFDGDGVPDLAIGRLPVRTLAEASRVVSKIVGYETNRPAGTWNNQVFLVADRDEGFSFTEAASEVGALVPPSMTVTKTLRSQSDAASTRSAILNGISSGQLLIGFLGHGSVEIWGAESLLRSSDAATMTNGGRLPLFIVMDCLNGFFHDVYTESLGEALLKAPNGGAVGVWASSGLTDPGAQLEMDKDLFIQLFGPQPLTIGEATVRAKRATTDLDTRRTWILMGDPATRLSR
ncbi:MAG: hypothetical protein DMF61_13160 [Blastocatellia bacterium AA13]|nr:MAG: hypothetical protein DMF61_13160 [Blastocatellia bacterium AA13]